MFLGVTVNLSAAPKRYFVSPLNVKAKKGYTAGRGWHCVSAEIEHGTVEEGKPRCVGFCGIKLDCTRTRVCKPPRKGFSSDIHSRSMLGQGAACITAVGSSFDMVTSSFNWPVGEKNHRLHTHPTTARCLSTGFPSLNIILSKLFPWALSIFMSIVSC